MPCVVPAAADMAERTIITSPTAASATGLTESSSCVSLSHLEAHLEAWFSLCDSCRCAIESWE